MIEELRQVRKDLREKLNKIDERIDAIDTAERDNDDDSR